MANEIAVAQKKELMLRPAVKLNDLIDGHREIADIIRDGLQDGIDYGVIPGSQGRDGKPPRNVLLKPGAERLCVAFGCRADYHVIESQIDHEKKMEWRTNKSSGTALGLYRYVIRCDLIGRGDGEIKGNGIASASSTEKKWAWAPRDNENTILKMAQKRALVAAVLNTFGLSDRFTQDIEEDSEIHIPQKMSAPTSKTETPVDMLSAEKPSKPMLVLNLGDVYKKALLAGIPTEEWKAMCASMGLTRAMGENQVKMHAMVELIEKVAKEKPRPPVVPVRVIDAATKGEEKSIDL